VSRTLSVLNDVAQEKLVGLTHVNFGHPYTQLTLLTDPICYIILIDSDLMKIKTNYTFLVYDKGEINCVVLR
jgi:hypothetical protein